MLNFVNDYSEGACPEVLRALVESNMEQLPGYGKDRYTRSAAERIARACGKPDAQVFFISGGTQTNQIVISTLLKQYQGVVAASTGHVNMHEAGAIEAVDHKVLTIPEVDGKLPAPALREFLETFWADANHEQMVFPGMVYISWPTEYGTLYSKAELTELHDICQQYEIPLYIDGARLGYGLVAPGTDVTLEDIANLADVFYIGGTKVGALCGEAVVFPKADAPEYFGTLIKRRGGLLAKGRLLGVQFDALFTDGLYTRISHQAIDTAEIIRKALREKDYEFFIDSPTNQTFVVIENSRMEVLRQQVNFDFWERKDADHTVIRFATSWATRTADAQALAELL
ncbi:threonine aldolase family protein [Bifidobacterium xylocopae]|uniref:Low specificity L-threonine aldolase n=1 Tax=Bifidobacterium xylocopae TaxID=2493119 RepID=A0A366KFP1_9BIFI|nr:aminotransferase class I/II-fold pyridoxal phosphate-dependent enzyme [Bifidobacterium xylocopae]RBP99913.1 low specificity L-threonine aldolase [Bifidobacterium xylocopae]